MRLVHLVVALTLSAKVAFAETARPAPRNLDLVFLLDTTGSMAEEIREAKERVQQLALALGKARPGATVRIGVVAYRDRGDQYLTLVSPLSPDVQRSFDFLATLRAEGGGDAPEDVLTGLAAALHDIDWNPAPEVDRQVFLIGDAPPHLDYADDPLPEDLYREAHERRIVINSVGCRSLSPDGIAFFHRTAYATEGAYQHIGRVQVTEEGGLAKAVLKALAVGEGAAGGEPVTTRLAERGPGEGGAGLQVEHVRTGDGSRCGLVLRVPNPLSLSGDPQVTRRRDGLVVRLALAPGQGERLVYELDACVPVSTPIHVHLEER